MGLCCYLEDLAFWLHRNQGASSWVSWTVSILRRRRNPVSKALVQGRYGLAATHDSSVLTVTQSFAFAACCADCGCQGTLLLSSSIPSCSLEIRCAIVWKAVVPVGSSSTSMERRSGEQAPLYNARGRANGCMSVLREPWICFVCEFQAHGVVIAGR